MKKTLRLLIPLLMGSMLMGCALVGKFDQNSYNAAQSLQGASLALMGQRLVSIPTNDIVTLQARLGAAVAYEQGKGAAFRLSTLQWQILSDPKGNLLGRFLTDWMNGSSCSAAYLTEKENQINEGFCEILTLEGAKLR